MRNEYKRLLAFILCLIMIFASVSECFAASKIKSTTVKLSSTSGTVTVKNASGKKQTVKEDMNLYSGYTIKTGKDSYAYVALDKSKAVKIDSLSEIEIRKSGRKLELYIIDGSIFCNVEEKLKSDESLNIRTNTMITGIRGTSVQFDVDGKDFAAKFFDGSGESVDLGTGKKYKIEAGSKFVGGESGNGAQGLAKMDNILDELSASAAEEIQGNEELAARIAKTFDTSTSELVNDIKEALPEMKAADQKAQEEKIKELEAAEKASSVVDDALKKSQVAKESEEKSSSGSGSGETKPVTPTPTPVVTTTYAINLPDDVATYFSITNVTNGVAIGEDGENKYKVTEGAIFTCTVTVANGATLKFSEGNYNSTTGTYSITANKDTTVTASATVSAVSKANAEAMETALEAKNIDTTIDTVTVTLPANTTGVLTFDAFGDGIMTSTPAINKVDYTVIKGTDFAFTVTTTGAIEASFDNATWSNGSYHITTNEDTTLAVNAKIWGVGALTTKEALEAKGVSNVIVEVYTVNLPDDITGILEITATCDGIVTSIPAINSYTVIKGYSFSYSINVKVSAFEIKPDGTDITTSSTDNNKSYNLGTVVNDATVTAHVKVSDENAKSYIAKLNEDYGTYTIDNTYVPPQNTITIPSNIDGVVTFTVSGTSVSHTGNAYTFDKDTIFELGVEGTYDLISFSLASSGSRVEGNITYYSFTASSEFDITATISTSATALFNIPEGIIVNYSSAVANSGTINIYGTANFQAGLNNSGTINNYGTINNTGTITNNGTIYFANMAAVLNGGSVVNNGDIYSKYLQHSKKIIQNANYSGNFTVYFAVTDSKDLIQRSGNSLVLSYETLYAHIKELKHSSVAANGKITKPTITGESGYTWLYYSGAPVYTSYGSHYVQSITSSDYAQHVIWYVPYWGSLNW